MGCRRYIIFVLAGLLLPVCIGSAKTGEGKARNHGPRPYAPPPPNTVFQGIQLMKDINDLMTTPSAANFLKVTRQLGVGQVQQGLGLVGSVVGGIIDILFPPDEGPSNEDVIREIQRTYTLLSNKIENIRDDIRNLEREIDWQNTQLQYADVVNKIRTAVELNMRIRQSTSDAEKRRRQDRFVEHCQNTGLLNALNALYDGLTGRGVFSRNILASYYRTSRGHRPNIVKLGGRLVQLVTGGLLSLMSYEDIKRGQGGAQDIAQDYQERMLLTRTSSETQFNLCDRNIMANMNADMREWLNGNSGSSPRDTAVGLYNRYSSKYDWKYMYVIAYKNVNGNSLHYVRGLLNKMTSCMNCHNKHVRVFFADRRAYPSKGRLSDAQRIVDLAGADSAQGVVDQIWSQFRGRGIPEQFIFAVRNGNGAHVEYRREWGITAQSDATGGGAATYRFAVLN